MGRFAEVIKAEIIRQIPGSLKTQEVEKFLKKWGLGAAVTGAVALLTKRPTRGIAWGILVGMVGMGLRRFDQEMQ